LLILTDDLGYGDLGAYGAADFETPNIDRIAATGVRFTDGYVTSPQCAPSRASLMSGISQLRFSYIHNSANEGLPPRDAALTFPELIREQGYTTALIGKWHIGFILDPKPDRYGYGLPGNDPWDRGFDYVLKHHGGGSDYFPYSEEGRRAMLAGLREPRLRLKAKDADKPVYIDGLPDSTYLTDYFSDQAVAFIREHQEEPWFLFLSYNAPHTPMQAKPEILKKYAHIDDGLRRTFVAMMHSLDEGIGKVITALRETGQLENTIVWFLSDNGGPTHQNASRNDPLSGRKGDVHEGGLRVPFLVSWPGVIPKGQVLQDPVSSLDILPTSLAAAGKVEIPAVHDGRNLLPWLSRSASRPPDGDLHFAWAHKSAIRIGDLKETRNGNEVLAVNGTTVPGHVFTNIRENPAELPGHGLLSAAEKQMLAQRLNQWLRQSERDQWQLTPGMSPPDWDGTNVIFATGFDKARQAGGPGHAIDHGGSVSSGFHVSPFTPGPGINTFRLDPTLPWDSFISEAAGTNPATTLREAVAAGAWFAFTVKADHPVDITGLKFTLRGYGNESRGQVTVRSSVDGFSSDLVTVSGSMVRKYPATVDLSRIGGFSGRDEVTFRFYLFDEFHGTDLVRLGIGDVEVAAKPTR
jgi:arylsulfatase B